MIEDRQIDRGERKMKDRKKDRQKERRKKKQISSVSILLVATLSSTRIMEPFNALYYGFLFFQIGL